MHVCVRLSLDMAMLYWFLWCEKMQMELQNPMLKVELAAECVGIWTLMSRINGAVWFTCIILHVYWSVFDANGASTVLRTYSQAWHYS